VGNLEVPVHSGGESLARIVAGGLAGFCAGTGELPHACGVTRLPYVPRSARTMADANRVLQSLRKDGQSRLFIRFAYLIHSKAAEVPSPPQIIGNCALSASPPVIQLYAKLAASAAKRSVRTG
jgi:hypothetical protein